ncbi:hypothetical protein BYT27DRAFT_7082444, partial [Phlegmacium glaucopus]
VKCSPVCPIENTNCCMARLLSQQDDFKNQPKTFICSRGTTVFFNFLFQSFNVSKILLKWYVLFTLNV